MDTTDRDRRTAAALRPYYRLARQRWAKAWELWHERGGPTLGVRDQIMLLGKCAVECGCRPPTPAEAAQSPRRGPRTP